ncbi:MAG: histidine kinase dimerization/phospho-acceptor domain-containing protein, partial [Bacteroidales bacterium]
MKDFIGGKNLSYSTLRQFIVFTVIIFLLATPVFYFLTRSYYAEELMDVIKGERIAQNISSTDLEEDIMTGVMIQYAIIIVLLGLSMVITLKFITRKLWNPFNDTLTKMEGFNLEQSEIPVFEESNITEFTRLNKAVSQLISRDKTVYKTQKQFTENASHELQTPLAIVKCKMDLLMQENLNSKQFILVSEIYGIVTKMGRINKDMLML